MKLQDPSNSLSPLVHSILSMFFLMYNQSRRGDRVALRQETAVASSRSLEHTLRFSLATCWERGCWTRQSTTDAMCHCKMSSVGLQFSKTCVLQMYSQTSSLLGASGRDEVHARNREPLRALPEGQNCTGRAAPCLCLVLCYVGFMSGRSVDTPLRKQWGVHLKMLGLNQKVPKQLNTRKKVGGASGFRVRLNPRRMRFRNTVEPLTTGIHRAKGQGFITTWARTARGGTGTAEMLQCRGGGSLRPAAAAGPFCCDDG